MIQPPKPVQPAHAAPVQPAPATQAPQIQTATSAISSQAVATVDAHPVGGVAGNCQPEYPAVSLRRNEQGVATVRVTVSAEGRAVAAEIAQSSGHSALDAAALAKVLRDCRFVPASRGGVPVEGVALQPMSFRILQ